MRYIDEYRDAGAATRLADRIRSLTTRPWTIMEVCGGQTHAIVRFGIDQLLPDDITLVHGPGCPVCVTPIELIDAAIGIARRPEVTLCSFGDMLRVPGSDSDLLRVQAGGGDVRVVYSPLDSVRIAEEHPDREVVHFAVGFETTAPANALAVRLASDRGLSNFSMIVSHVLVPPALEAILSAESSRVQGFLAAGHVCAIMGEEQYRPIARRYGVPIVVTGFEPLDILHGVAVCIEQLEAGRCDVVNPYARAVRREGNPAARALIAEVFEISERRWRGIGDIPASGLALRPPYDRFDALARFDTGRSATRDDSAVCIAGEVLRGLKRPGDCPAFGNRCTPDHPVGAPMVSDEGACAAYYRYRRLTVGGAEL